MATMATHLNVMIHEAWDEQAVADAVAIFDKVRHALAR